MSASRIDHEKALEAQRMEGLGRSETAARARRVAQTR